jgi:putative flippase GtrA
MVLPASLRSLASEHGAKLFRYGAVSAFNVLFGQGLLYAAQTIIGWPAVVSNVFAVTVSAGPAYLLSRYWVWQKSGRSHLIREVLPFWSLALLGSVLSTAAIWFVERRWDPHPLIINLTNLGAFGVLWVGKFFLLDQLLFNSGGLSDEPLDAFVQELVSSRTDPASAEVRDHV